MITVAVIGIIAGVAYPSYQSQVQKSRRADAKASLERMAQIAERCRTHKQPMTYAGCVDATYNAEFYTLTRDSADANGFSITATATGAQLKDTGCRTFTLTSANLQTAKDSANADNSAVCWKR
ncbi:MAG TPA: type IV pilin protein, partial [Nitrospiraceae bacterium]|nr:type IV pilin protein [Nitrospiraceae bacterium]